MEKVEIITGKSAVFDEVPSFDVDTFCFSSASWSSHPDVSPRLQMFAAQSANSLALTWLSGLRWDAASSMWSAQCRGSTIEYSSRSVFCSQPRRENGLFLTHINRTFKLSVSWLSWLISVHFIHRCHNGWTVIYFWSWMNLTMFFLLLLLCYFRVSESQQKRH